LSRAGNPAGGHFINPFFFNMKHNYIGRLFLFFGVFAFGLASCAETEDMVSPKETCATMATVQYQQGTGIKLVLENGLVLRPENAKQLSAQKQVFAIDGFSVKAGQHILIGYKPTAPATQQQAGGKSVKVNCIVGLSPQ
jgi:hypothetical protein